MKKTLMLSAAFLMLTSYAANAQVSVTFGEPAYVAPAPVYYEPAYPAYPTYYVGRGVHNHHRDYAYWDHRNHGHDDHGHDHDHGHR